MATPLVIKNRQARLPIVSQPANSGLSGTNQPRVVNIQAVKNNYARLPAGRALR